MANVCPRQRCSHEQRAPCRHSLRGSLLVTYGLVGRVTDLLAHKLVHPLVGLVVVATVGREAGDDERHVWWFVVSLMWWDYLKVV